MLFGVEGLQVTDAQAGPDGTLEVWAVTDYPAAAACPDCQAVSGRRDDTVLARPRDVRRAGDPVAVWWVKSRWKCGEPGCDRKTFTEWLPQVPPRCRLTARLREQAGAEITDRGITGSTPSERNVRDRWFAFCDWCAQNDDIPEPVTLARTVSRWEDEIVCAVLTGVTNAASESLNRLAKLEARLAYGFRNPASQRRRVRIACTRGRGRKSRAATSRRIRPVTGPEPHPG